MTIRQNLCNSIYVQQTVDELEIIMTRFLCSLLLFLFLFVKGGSL